MAALRGRADHDAPRLLRARRGDQSDTAATTIDGSRQADSGGNPDLEPIRSTNLDAAFEWYFADELAAVGRRVLHGPRQLRRFRHRDQTYLTFNAIFPDGAFRPIRSTVPVNASGRVQGVRARVAAGRSRELRLCGQLHLRRRRGDALVPPSGDDRLVGASKNTYNLSALLREHRFNARLDLHLPLGVLQRPGSQHGVLPGRHRLAVGVARLHGQRQLLAHPRRAEPQRPDAQVLRRQQGPAARVLRERARSTTSNLRFKF